MALLKKRETPSGGWTYLQAETQVVITGENKDNLIDLVIAHRTYKGLPTTDREEVRKEIERQICTRLGHRECREEGPDDPWVAQDASRPLLTLSRVMGFSRAAIEFVKGGMNLVEKEVAQERAAICKTCPENRAATGCNCGDYHAIVAAAIPADRKIDGLFICWNCGCELQSKVNLTENVVVASNKGQKNTFPHFCWQKKIMDAHKQDA